MAGQPANVAPMPQPIPQDGKEIVLKINVAANAPTVTQNVIITGNLTRDPELRHLPSGTPVLQMGLAVNGRQKDDADKRGGVRDAGGTTWWIATKVG